jgi:hypothetical protein
VWLATTDEGDKIAGGKITTANLTLEYEKFLEQHTDDHKRRGSDWHQIQAKKKVDGSTARKLALARAMRTFYEKEFVTKEQRDSHENQTGKKSGNDRFKRFKQGEDLKTALLETHDGIRSCASWIWDVHNDGDGNDGSDGSGNDNEHDESGSGNGDDGDGGGHGGDDGSGDATRAPAPSPRQHQPLHLRQQW